MMETQLAEVTRGGQTSSMSSDIAQTFIATNGETQIEVQSRFGPVTVELAQAVYFPHGMLGLKEEIHFAITDIPREGMGQFKLLQCLNDHEVSFVVLPVDIENQLIAIKDLKEACNVLNIKEENLLTLLVVTVHRTPSGNKVTANLRAPVIVDVRDKMAIQYVFPTNKYEISHPLFG